MLFRRPNTHSTTMAAMEPSPFLHSDQGMQSKLDREKVWVTPAVVSKESITPRSYLVITPQGVVLRRNHRHLRLRPSPQPTPKPRPPPTEDAEGLPSQWALKDCYSNGITKYSKCPRGILKAAFYLAARKSPATLDPTTLPQRRQYRSQSDNQPHFFAPGTDSVTSVLYFPQKLGERKSS